MATINFVPNDYLQQRQSSRVNMLYLLLLAALLGAIAMTFGFIKIRQKAVAAEMERLNERMIQAKEQIAQLEELKTKGKTMLKTMMMTAELIEPAPRSIILAGLTNTLPAGVSLLDLTLTEKEIKITPPVSSGTDKAAGGAAKAKSSLPEEPQTRIETTLELMGIAPSDLEVAAYIARLGSSVLFGEVELIESKEQIIDSFKFRQFKLKTMLKPNLSLTKEDIDSIRIKHQANAL